MKNQLRRFNRALKLIVMGMYILLILTVSFFHIYTHRNGGVDYFYFSLLFAIPFFFNDRKDYPSIFLIVFTITLSFTACIYFSFDFLPKSRFLDYEDYKVIKLLNILFTVITFLIDIILVSQKDGLIHRLVKDTVIKNSTIEDLLKANNDMVTQQIINNNLTEQNITDILELAETNSPLFLEKFQSCFPDFTPSVLIINPKLIYSEIHLCALMRLNFDTKKIALITKSSVRAIESRKYRIRKKLHISPEVNINNFILKI
nr:Two component regulator three Y domain-containing protein [uncultured Chryseobacterium sp.]